MKKVIGLGAAVVGGFLLLFKVLPLILGLVLSLIFPPLFFLFLIAFVLGGFWLWAKSKDE